MLVWYNPDLRFIDLLFRKMVEDNQVPTFLLLCDKVLACQAKQLDSALRQQSNGCIILWTLEEVPEAKGDTLSKKLDNNLRNFARVNVVICSENLTKYIDSEDMSSCPKLLKENEDCHKVIRDFPCKRREVRTKLILVSLNGDESVPAALKDMQIITKEGTDKTVYRQIIAEVISRM